MTSILYGEYDLSIDVKNRLSIPSAVRQCLDAERDGQMFYMLIGPNGKLWFHPERWYEALAAKMASEMSPDADHLEFDQMTFAMTCKEGWDKQGRLLIPERIFRRSRLGRDVTMIGVRDHLELWNAPEWEVESVRLDAARGDISRRAKNPVRPVSVVATI